MSIYSLIYFDFNLSMIKIQMIENYKELYQKKNIETKSKSCCNIGIKLIFKP